MEDIVQKLFDLLQAEFGLNKDNLNADTKIFSDGILDSLSSLQLIMHIERMFSISVSPLDVSIDDIDTVDSMAALIDRKRSE